MNITRSALKDSILCFVLKLFGNFAINRKLAQNINDIQEYLIDVLIGYFKGSFSETSIDKKTN